MEPIKVRSTISDPLLTTRSLAQELEPSFKEHGPSQRIELDFEGIEGITPSFFDGLLKTMEDTIQARSSNATVVFHNLPRGVSSALELVARAHNLTLRSDEERWVLSPRTSTAS